MTQENGGSRESDAVVAEEVMGAVHQCELVRFDDGTLGLNEPCAAWRVRSKHDTYWRRWSPDGAEKVVNDFLPHYSTDIAAAWEIVEWARKKFSRWEAFTKVLQLAVSESLSGDDVISHSDVWRLVKPHHICEAALSVARKEANRGDQAQT